VGRGGACLLRRANSAHIRQSRPDSGLGLGHFLGQTSLKRCVPFSLGLVFKAHRLLYLRLIDVSRTCLGVWPPPRVRDMVLEEESEFQGLGSYLRLIDSCFSQLKAQGPSRTCNESKEEKQV